VGAKLLKQPDAIPSGDLADWGPVAQPAGDVVSHGSGLHTHQTTMPEKPSHSQYVTIPENDMIRH